MAKMSRSPMDRWISHLDDSLRILNPGHIRTRPSPATTQPEDHLPLTAQRKSAGLMRVNHAGEICAQGLYAGQAILARSPEVRRRMLSSAAEEQDHLAWCQSRLDELGAQPSVLWPLWMAASFGLGMAVALAGDKTSLGFLAATEAQVCEHLDEHLQQLPEEDRRSRAVLEQMREEEEHHGAQALAAGGTPFPTLIQKLMRLSSGLMVGASYYI